MTLKQRIYNLIDDDNKAGLEINSFIGTAIMALIILSIVAVILESDANLSLSYHNIFLYFEIFAVVIFTIEYLLRMYTATLEYPDHKGFRAVWKYMTSTMAIIDFLAILPFYLELGILIYSTSVNGDPETGMLDLRFIRVLRLMRLLRIFKLNRYNSSMQMIGNVIKEEKEKLFITIFITGILLVLSSAIIFTVEHDQQPEQFPNIYSSMWWAIATLTTVGYGDVYPVTALGKMLAGVIALLGIGLVALPTGILSGSFVAAIKKQKEEEAEEKKLNYNNGPNYCSHCGSAIDHSHSHE